MEALGTKTRTSPWSQSRGQLFCVCLWVRTALASKGGLEWHLRVWAASRSLGLRQKTINTPQLSSLSCWLWSANSNSLEGMSTSCSGESSQ